MPKNSIEINNAEDYCAWASDVLSEMTETIMDDKRYVRPVTEEDEDIDPDWTFIFTRKGQEMVCNWHNRLVALGEAKFPGEEIEVENWHYSEG